MKRACVVFWGFAALLLSFGSLRAAEIELSTANWENNQDAFSLMGKTIAENAAVNLLNFKGAKIAAIDAVQVAEALTDGDPGILGQTGRVLFDAAPSRIVYYLGSAHNIKEIRVFSGNIDTRSNQDYEIRLANNEAKPGEMPAFPENATLTTGDTILGANGGGFMTRFAKADGSNLFDEKYDWIEFRVWRTYKPGNQTPAGSPAKAQNASESSASMVEFQVVMDLNEPGLFASEQEKADWEQVQRRRMMDLRIDQFGSEMAFALRNPESLKRAIDDMTDRFGDDFDPKDYAQRWEGFAARIANPPEDEAELAKLVEEYGAFRREVLLSNPLLTDFDRILVRKGTNPALEQNWMSNASRPKGEYDNALISFNPANPSEQTVIAAEGPNKSFIGDICLHWNADKCLVTALSDQKTWQIFECNLADGALRQVTPDMGGDIDNVEGCYVPDGATVFVSSASMMGVPCIGGTGLVGNIYRVEADGKTVRQLTFEQDQDWCPTLLPNGRILYLRWEYVDIPHYFSRIMFTMNPDGTNQVEHYGSGSFWPNSLFYCKPIPGQSSKFVGIVSGHHGVAREGELTVFDPSLGRQEADGALQRIPGWGKKVEPTIADQLVDNSWPKFLFPSPLDDAYIIASGRLRPQDPWGVYLVDIFDNLLKLWEEPGWHLMEPTPLIARDEPQKIIDRTKPGEKEATVFITDLYFGQGLPDVPVGTIKKLRLFAYSYGYRGIGGHDIFGMESGWDGRRLLGEVPVNPDGSATFKIPANTPIALQPLDADGAAVQLMRSWFVGMPGESESCIGCHETQNSVSPGKLTEARNAEPISIQPFYGPERPFSFEGEMQPVLDKFCVGCHDGTEKDRPNFADTNKGPRGFSNAYHALHGYVRRPGPESDIHTFRPMEYHSSTSELVQMLEKGHHNVKLDREGWDRLHCWIDLNTPYFGTWTEIAEMRNNQKGSDPLRGVADRYIELKELYADSNLDYESGSYYAETKPERPAFIKPEETPDPDRSAPALENWPFKPQNPPEKQTVQVADGVSFDLVKIPAGNFIMGDEDGFLDELPRREATVAQPFWMMTTEVTNALYKLFDADHDSRFIDQWNKDHNTPGYPANKPEQPVIRVTWKRANDFCAWLTEKTGKHFRLPTEAEWEWAARAGSDTPMWFGALDSDFGKLENLADESTRLFVVAGVNPQPQPHADWEAFMPRANGVDDGNFMEQAVGQYEANPFGLHDMLGSVSEWTASDYKPYPYNADDGRNNGAADVKKVARGGSWADRPKWARSGVRKPYETWQPVYNVGIRAVCDE